MKKDIKPAISLFLICAITTFLLALVFQMTKPAIEKRNMQEKAELQKEVMPEADKFADIDIDESAASKIKGAAILEQFSAKKGDGTIGNVFSVSVNGYKKELRILVGIKNDMTVSGMRVLSHEESPGLGAVAAEPRFYEEFSDLKAENGVKVKKGGGDASAGTVDAISGATITSNAVAGAVNAALDYTKLTNGGEK